MEPGATKGAGKLHLHHHEHGISRARREEAAGHRGSVLWLTGLSGAGKSTLANAVEARLFNAGIRTYILDGDNIRLGLNKDLDFSEAGRRENIRRVAEVAKLFCEAGLVVITCFISPMRADRAHAKSIVGEEDFIEVFLRASLECCEARDPKGLYRKARDGVIPNFTGISAPYEPPDSPDLEVETGQLPLDDCTQQVINYLQHRGVIKQLR